MASTVSLAFDILARDRASREFNNVGKSMDEASKKGASFGKILGGVVAAGIGAATAVLKTGFDEVKDYQVGMADLTNVLKTTHNAAGVSTKSLEDLASSIQDYSGQTDDSIVKSEGMLLTFTNIHNAAGKNNDIFTQATKLTADMAQKFGGDASESAVKLGKALNDPAKGLTALSKIGVSFTDQQKQQIKKMQEAGNVQGAQKIILAELTKEVGGSAKAYGQTLAGQTDRAKRKFEDFSQGLFQKMIPALTATGTWVQNNAGWLKPLVIVIGTAVLAYGAVTKAIALTNAVMAMNPIGLVVVAIAALVAALVVAYQHSETFRSIVQGAFSAVSSACSAMWGVIKPVFKFIVDTWFMVTGAIINGAASAFGWVPGIGGKLKSAAKEFNKFRDQVNAALGGVTKSVHVTVNADVALHETDQTGRTIGGVLSPSNRATGGSMVANMPYLTSENGPELFVPHQAGHMLNATQTAAALRGGGAGGGGGMTTVQLVVDKKVLHSVLLDLRRERGTGLGLG